jgi:hypothetical protein
MSRGFVYRPKLELTMTLAEYEAQVPTATPTFVLGLWLQQIFLSRKSPSALSTYSHTL